MVSQGHALSRDELVRALVSHTGIATADGAVTNDSLIDSNLIGWDQRKIVEKTILISSGGSNLEDAAATVFNPVNGEITISPAFSNQILAGTVYRIINISTVELDVLHILTRIGTNVDLAGTTTLFAWMAKLFAGMGGIPVILALVNAMLTLTETGGTVIATGLLTEDDVYINDAPAGVFKPLLVTIDMSDLAAGEVATVRTRYRIEAGGAPELKGAPVIFAGVQTEPLKDVELKPNRFGLEVTIEATAAVVFPWEVHYEV